MKHDPFYPGREEGPILSVKEISNHNLTLDELVKQGKQVNLLEQDAKYKRLATSILYGGKNGFIDCDLPYGKLGSKQYTITGNNFELNINFAIEKRIWSGDISPQMKLWYIHNANIKVSEIKREINLILDSAEKKGQIGFLVDGEIQLRDWLDIRQNNMQNIDYAFIGMIDRLSKINEYIQPNQSFMGQIVSKLKKYFTMSNN